MSTTIAGAWPPSPANDTGLRVVKEAKYIVYKDPYDQKYHAAVNGSLGQVGTDIINSDAATVINPALAAGGKTFIKADSYPINSQLNMVSNGELWLEQGTVLKATASIAAVVGFSGASISRSRINGGRIDCNGLAANGTNWGQSEISAINRISNCVFSNSTGKAIILDGNEDTKLDFCLIEPSNADGVSWSIVNGAGVWSSTISNVPLTGTDLSGLWQQMVIDSNSVLNTIDVGASNVTVIRDSYLANRQATIKSTAAGGTNTIDIYVYYIVVGSSSPNFINVTKVLRAL